MRQLTQGRFSRSGFRPPPTGTFSIRLPLLFFLSMALIALSRLDHPAVRELRAEAEAFVAPALGAAMVPLEPARRLLRQIQSSYDGFAEVEQLRGEVQRLKQWESRAHALERRMTELAALANALPENRTDYRTVRVIATSSGAFVNSALLEGGTDSGIRVGQPVMSASGLVGRIVEVGRRTSRVLLLTDVNSRIPVIVGGTQMRAILAGDNTEAPRLLMLQQGAVVEDRQDVLTTGVGGMFPRGIRVGLTSTAGAVPRVTLDAALGELEYVSVLMFENPGTVLSRELRPIERDTVARGRGATDRGGRP